MLIKRLALCLISLVVGFGITWLIVEFIATTTLEQYGIWYTGFTALAIACAIGVWLDKFMGTEILPK
jgi:hypothetical protein